MGLTPHRAAKDASPLQPLRVVAGGGQQRSSDLGADAGSCHQRRGGSGAQARDLRVELCDLGAESPPARREAAQRSLGAGGGFAAAGVRPQP